MPDRTGIGRCQDEAALLRPGQAGEIRSVEGGGLPAPARPRVDQDQAEGWLRLLGDLRHDRQLVARGRKGEAPRTERWSDGKAATVHIAPDVPELELAR